MPIYEYECLACKHRFERFQSFSEAPVAACPDCGSPVRKVMQPVGIVFKGSGWYKTDSRNASAAGKADAAKDSAVGASAEAKASGEAKADGAAKSDGAPKPDSSGKTESSSSDSSSTSEGSSKPDNRSKPVPAAASSGSGQ